MKKANQWIVYGFCMIMFFSVCVAGQSGEESAETKMPFRAAVEARLNVLGSAGGGVKLRFVQGFDIVLGGYGNWDGSGFGAYGEGAYRLPLQIPVSILSFVRAGYHLQKVDTLLNNRRVESALDMFSVAAGISAEKEFGQRFSQAIALKVGGRYSKVDYTTGSSSFIGDNAVTVSTATYSRFPLLIEAAYTFYLPQW